MARSLQADDEMVDGGQSLVDFAGGLAHFPVPSHGGHPNYLRRFENQGRGEDVLELDNVFPKDHVYLARVNDAPGQPLEEANEHTRMPNYLGPGFHRRGDQRIGHRKGYTTLSPEDPLEPNAT